LWIVAVQSELSRNPTHAPPCSRVIGYCDEGRGDPNIGMNHAVVSIVKIFRFVWFTRRVFTSNQRNAVHSPDAKPTDTVESAIDKAKRAFALKKYEQAIEHYATALELV
jgi:hypothetical protein